MSSLITDSTADPSTEVVLPLDFNALTRAHSQGYGPQTVDAELSEHDIEALSLSGVVILGEHIDGDFKVVSESGQQPLPEPDMWDTVLSDGELDGATVDDDLGPITAEEFGDRHNGTKLHLVDN